MPRLELYMKSHPESLVCLKTENWKERRRKMRTVLIEKKKQTLERSQVDSTWTATFKLWQNMRNPQYENSFRKHQFGTFFYSFTSKSTSLSLYQIPPLKHLCKNCKAFESCIFPKTSTIFLYLSGSHRNQNQIKSVTIFFLLKMKLKRKWNLRIVLPSKVFLLTKEQTTRMTLNENCYEFFASRSQILWAVIFSFFPSLLQKNRCKSRENRNFFLPSPPPKCQRNHVFFT